MSEVYDSPDYGLFDEICIKITNSFIDGATINEAMTLVLQSDEYKEWKSTTRSFEVQFEDEAFYTNILDSITMGKNLQLVDEYVNYYFYGSQSDKPTDGNMHEFIFKKLGMLVTVEQLGYEIAQLSKTIKIKEPLYVSHFLSLFKGTASTDFESEQFDSIFAHEEAVTQFVEKFHMKYGGNKDS